MSCMKLMMAHTGASANDTIVVPIEPLIGHLRHPYASCEPPSDSGQASAPSTLVFTAQPSNHKKEERAWVTCEHAHRRSPCTT